MGMDQARLGEAESGAERFKCYHFKGISCGKVSRSIPHAGAYVEDSLPLNVKHPILLRDELRIYCKENHPPLFWPIEQRNAPVAEIERERVASIDERAEPSSQEIKEISLPCAPYCRPDPFLGA